jgi:hypothetical protein
VKNQAAAAAKMLLFPQLVAKWARFVVKPANVVKLYHFESS